MDAVGLESNIDLNAIEKRKAKLIARLQKRNATSESVKGSNLSEKKSREFELDRMIEKGKLNAEKGVVDEDIINRLEEALSLECGVHNTKRIQNVLESLRRAAVAKDNLPTLGSFSFVKRSPKSVKPLVNEVLINNNNVKDNDVELRPSQTENIIDISNLTDVVSTVNGDDGSSLNVKNLQNCVLRFPFRPSAVHIHNVQNCTLIFLPVETSILMHNVKSSKIWACAQQIRVHDSYHVLFNIGVAGAIIFEGCRDILLSPYRLKHNNEQVKPPNGDQWKRPSDFDWLAEGPSPNWRITDETEWESMVSL